MPKSPVADTSGHKRDEKSIWASGFLYSSPAQFGQEGLFLFSSSTDDGKEKAQEFLVTLGNSVAVSETP